ncbi:MAG: 50S ribosomal protein L21e [Nanoarchaeota archaeon]|nr:50S ribosomal protein L21e [Nanoarchaeota archaeon]
MSKRTKNVRSKGKIPLSKYFQEFEDGEFVAVVKERAVPSSFPERLQGRTGVVNGKRGRSYIIKLDDLEKQKTFIIEPIHLKKIKVHKEIENK